MKKDKSLTLADRIKSFDFYKDLPQDLAEPTMSGASGKIPLTTFNFFYVLYLSFHSVNHSHMPDGSTIRSQDLRIRSVLEDL